MNAKSNSIRCQIATMPEHIRDSMIMRSICFVQEHGIAPNFIFDGNDHQATHVVFYDGDEPIGSLRIRWFAEFAKYERTCFREAYRHPSVLKRCIRMTFEHVARKGYAKVMTQAEPRLARLWTILFKGEFIDTQPVQIPGHGEPYLSVIGAIDRHPCAITPESDSALLLRIEGEWDRPTAFEAHS
ncbi:hypothetical protein [Aureimonas sp. AU12]|uniref:hypothetical protein n=1 Tax=Aureimonas sp. AU12 TaxID=1638161 RepID=UPI000A6B004A|nr:hypothetical protein [Aureimonas sp. AU12]